MSDKSGVPVASASSASEAHIKKLKLWSPNSKSDTPIKLEALQTQSPPFEEAVKRRRSCFVNSTLLRVHLKPRRNFADHGPSSIGYVTGLVVSWVELKQEEGLSRHSRFCHIFAGTTSLHNARAMKGFKGGGSRAAQKLLEKPVFRGCQVISCRRVSLPQPPPAKQKKTVLQRLRHRPASRESWRVPPARIL